MRRKHPDLFEKAVKLEENGQNFPKTTIKEGHALREIVSKTEMCDYMGDPCVRLSEARLRKRRISKSLILKHRNYDKCPYSLADLTHSAYCYGKFPCPCKTFPCCYDQVMTELNQI
jgi:hypothetical protein